MESNVPAVEKATEDALHAALLDVAMVWLGKATLVTPVDSGVLRASLAYAVNGTRRHSETAQPSGEIVAYNATAPRLTARVGSNTEYAAAVHERLDPTVNWSARGTGPKFIETPLRENRDQWIAMIRSRLGTDLGGEA